MIERTNKIRNLTFNVKKLILIIDNVYFNHNYHHLI